MSAESATTDTHQATKRNANPDASLPNTRPENPVVNGTPVARQEEIPAVTGPKTSDAAATEPGITSTVPAARSASIAVTYLAARDTAEAESAAIDSPASSRAQSPAHTDSASSDATETESCTTNGSPAKQEDKIASSYPETPGVGQSRESRVCSPKFLQPPPPLDFPLFVLKLWDVYVLQQRGYSIELPCHIPRDPHDTNSTPTPTYWLSGAAPSPWAVGPASSSESESETPPRPGVKPKVKFGKRKWTGKGVVYDEYTSEPEDPESDRKRQKRWIGP